MAAGFGGMLAQILGGDPAAMLARRMSLTDPTTGQQTMASGATGPIPGGPPAPGGASLPPGPGTAAGAVSALPGVQAYAPDPANAANIAALTQPAPGQSTGELMLKIHQQDQAAQGLNQGLAQIASHWASPAAGQAMIQAASGPAENRLGVIAGIAPMQMEKNQLDEHNRYMANTSVLAPLLGITPEVAQTAANAGVLPAMLQHRFGEMGPTDAQKNFAAAQAGVAQQVQAEHPDWSPAQVKAETNVRVPPSMLMSGVAGGDLANQEYFQYQAAERAAGRTPLGPVEWQEQLKNKAISLETQTKDSQAFKDSAVRDYTPVNSKLQTTQQLVDQLLADVPSTMKALQYPDLLTTGKSAAWDPFISQAVKSQAIALNKLRASLTGEGLSNVKNVRNVSEFSTLGQAATGGLDAANDPQSLTAALQDIQNKVLDARATMEMTVGHKLTGNLVGHGNRDLLQPTINGQPNPYYNGATEETPSQPGGAALKPMPADTKAAAQQLIASDPRQRGPLMDHLRSQGIDPTGL